MRQVPRIHPEPRPFRFLRRNRPEASVQSLHDVDLDLERIIGAVKREEGYPRIDWSVVQQAAAHFDKHPALDQIWTELASQWLELLGNHLGDRYRIFESQHVLLLSAQPSDEARRFLEVADAAYARLQDLIAPSKEALGCGKHVIFMPLGNDAYYDYVSFYHPDEDSNRGASAGMHIGRGYKHTVICGHATGAYLRTMAHELAHNMVSHLPLPLWLNEGLAQRAEDMIGEFRGPLIGRRGARLQTRYWSRFGLDPFWTGKSFFKRSSQRLSYQLSNILFRNLTSHRSRRKNVRTFLATAHRRDAGQAACLECFGCPLSTLVEEFLGEGDWDPHLETSASSASAPAPVKPPNDQNA